MGRPGGMCSVSTFALSGSITGRHAVEKLIARQVLDVATLTRYLAQPCPTDCSFGMTTPISRVGTPVSSSRRRHPRPPRRPSSNGPARSLSRSRSCRRGRRLRRRRGRPARRRCTAVCFAAYQFAAILLEVGPCFVVDVRGLRDHVRHGKRRLGSRGAAVGRRADTCPRSKPVSL